MATIESGLDANHKLRVDPNGAARMSLRPIDGTVGEGQEVGHYVLGLRSGAVASAAVTADAPMFSVRWISPVKKMIVTRLDAFYVPVVAFTAAQEIGLCLRKLTAFSAADSGGLAVDLTGAPVDTRSQPSLADMRVATTTIVTAGTRTRAAHTIAGGSGFVNDLNVAAGTEYLQPSQRFGFSWEANQARGEKPLILNPNEGLAVENLVVFPAAGTVRLFVSLAWVEAPGY